MNFRDIRPGADLSGHDLSDIDFYELFGLKTLNGGPGANLQGCMFRDTNLRASRHYHSEFMGADLTRADMSETHCYETLFGRGKAHAHEIPALLLNANFNGAYLGGSHLNGVNASGASFIDANLSFCQAVGAVFCETNFEGADFSNANLSGANFQGANLTAIITSESTLFSGAIMPDGSIHI